MTSKFDFNKTCIIISCVYLTKLLQPSVKAEVIKYWDGQKVHLGFSLLWKELFGQSNISKNRHFCNKSKETSPIVLIFSEK